MKEKFKQIIKDYRLLIILAVTTVVIFAFKDVKMEKNHLLLAFVMLALVILLAFFYKWIKLARLVDKGSFQKALTLADDLLQRHEKNGAMRNSALFIAANCHARLGEFKRANECLDKLDSSQADQNYTWTYQFAYAVNSLFLKKNLDVTKTYLEKAMAIMKPVDMYPVLAYYEVQRKNLAAAGEYVEQYLNRGTYKRRGFRLFSKSNIDFDKFTYEVENNYYIGAYYLNIGKVGDAKKYLSLCAGCSYDNFFSGKAKELLREM